MPLLRIRRVNSGMERSTSSRTASPKRRRRTSSSMASRRSSASSSSIAMSASRVTRNRCVSRISMPRNSSSRLASMTWSRSTNRLGSTSNEPGQERRDLDAGEPVLAGLRVAQPHGDRQRERADVRERVSRVDRERGEHREDLVVEPLGERPVVLGDVVVVEDLDALGRQPTPQVGKDRGLLGHELEDARANGVQLLLGRPAVGREGLGPAQLLAPQPGHAYLEEFVEVVDEEVQRADAVEERIAAVAGLVEHPGVVLEPRELAIEDRDSLVPCRPSATAAGSARTGCWANGGHGPLNDRTGPGRGRDDTSDPIPVGPPRIPRRRSRASSETPRSWGVPVTRGTAPSAPRRTAGRRFADRRRRAS